MSSPQITPQPIRMLGHICEGQQFDTPGHAVRVTVVQGGRSKNGYVYTEAVLKEIAHLVEGAQAYADHAHDEMLAQARSVRDIVGFYRDVQYIGPDIDHSHGRVDATLHILEVADWLWLLVHESCVVGHPNLIGLSIDILGHWEMNETTRVREVTQVVALNSCDIVTRPSAGGVFQRILHALPPSISPQGETLMDQQQNLPVSSVTSSDGEHIQESKMQIEQIMHAMQIERAQMALERRLRESILPEPVKANVRARFQGRHFEEHELDAELKGQQGMLAALADSGLIRGHSFEKASVGQVVTEAEKLQAAFDRMFNLEINSAKLGNIRAFSSIREAYTRVSGDAAVSRLNDIVTGQSLGDEWAQAERVREADVTTASFAFLLGTSMNKQLLKDYQTWPAEWMKFVNVVAIRDFKQQSRVRMGAFGSLSTVTENSAYTAIALGDSAALYSAQKRGNLVNVTREVILNDDLHAIQQIPGKLAAAAAYTLAEFVYGFLITNPTIYDGDPLFTASDPHNNLVSGALSSATLQGGVTAVRKQRNTAGKRLGLRPRYLIVPPELEWNSRVQVQSTHLPGGELNDINPLQGFLMPIVSAQLSDSAQWFLAADPREIDTIEIGFIGGQVNPTLYVQDQPQIGGNFTHDVITYKVRHEYGGAVVDYRGLFRGN